MRYFFSIYEKYAGKCKEVYAYYNRAGYEIKKRQQFRTGKNKKTIEYPRLNDVFLGDLHTLLIIQHAYLD